VLWRSIQALPHTLGVVQSLILICTWPFPTSSSSTDPSYMLAGLIVQLGLQMGLHRPKSPEDFNKFRLNLDNVAVADRTRTWIASNIVVQRYVVPAQQVQILKTRQRLLWCWAAHTSASS
jgi:transcriptional regulatory protein LEU3